MEPVEAWWLNKGITRKVQTSLLGIMVGTFLVVQWLRLCLAMQVVRFLNNGKNVEKGSHPLLARKVK